MSSLIRLLEYVDVQLANADSFVMDGDTVREVLQWPDLPWKRATAHRIAWVIVELRRNICAASEAFLNNETREELRVYMVCAKNREAYGEAVTRLRERVAAELSGTMARAVEYPHLHSQPEEAVRPSPLIEPLPDEGNTTPCPTRRG